MDEKTEIIEQNKLLEESNIKLDETLNKISSNYAKINASLEELKKQIAVKSEEQKKFKTKKFFYTMQADILAIQTKLSQANTRVQNVPLSIFEVLYELPEQNLPEEVR